MATRDDKPSNSKNLETMISELETELDLGRQHRAKSASNTLNAAFEIKSTVVKLDTYLNLKHTETYGIVIPESSIPNLLKMLKNIFEGENK